MFLVPDEYQADIYKSVEGSIKQGAAIAFAALLLILPGFATDIIGILLVFPVTRKIILKKYSRKYSSKNKPKENNLVEGEYEDIQDKDGK